MPKKTKASPKLCRQRVRGRPDRAYVVLDSRKFYLGRYGTKQTKASYHRVLAEYEANGGTLPNCDPQTITVKEVIAAYWKYAERLYRDSGELDAIRRACKPLVKLYGDTPASEFGPKALRTMRDQWVRKDTWSRKTINTQVTKLKRIFKWATENELVPAHVHHGLAARPACGGVGPRHASPAR